MAADVTFPAPMPSITTCWRLHTTQKNPPNSRYSSSLYFPDQESAESTKRKMNHDECFRRTHSSDKTVYDHVITQIFICTHNGLVFPLIPENTIELQPSLLQEIEDSIKKKKEKIQKLEEERRALEEKRRALCGT